MNNHPMKVRIWDGDKMHYPKGGSDPFVTTDRDGNLIGMTTVPSFGALPGGPMRNKVLPDVMLSSGLKDATEWEDLSEEERSDWTRSGHMPSEWEGREIYQKDVIATPDCYETIMTIGWRLSSFYLINSRGAPVRHLDEYLMQERQSQYSDAGRVIGNLYENPALATEFTAVL